jgi:hypothetical protein
MPLILASITYQLNTKLRDPFFNLNDTCVTTKHNGPAATPKS